MAKDLQSMEGLETGHRDSTGGIICEDGNWSRF